MDTQGWFTAEEFAPGAYIIGEGRWRKGCFYSYLFLGEERALAVDGGLGVADMRRLHESITDLPIDFVLTHTHWDHLGAAYQWESVGVHPLGRDLLAEDHTADARAMLARLDGPLPPGFAHSSYTIRPARFGRALQEGDAIDLGGRRLRVFDTPGHSHDSISFLDEREGVLVTGDLMKPEHYLYVQLPTSSLPDYGPSLRKLAAVAGEVRWVCSGHTPPYADASILAETAQFMEEVQAGLHDPPKKVDGDYWGIVDEYQAPRCKVWVQDHARR